MLSKVRMGGEEEKRVEWEEGLELESGHLCKMGKDYIKIILTKKEENLKKFRRRRKTSNETERTFLARDKKRKHRTQN